jgi:myo-inositol-1(or 4)-monophosphatase
LGSLDTGITYNGRAGGPSTRRGLDGAVVLASRSEIKRGEWDRFKAGKFEVRPMGSVAYKLALVAAGRADATWTLTPKNEWDVAAGVALIEAAGGFARSSKNTPLRFNNRSPLLPGLWASGPNMRDEVTALLDGQHDVHPSEQRDGRP